MIKVRKGTINNSKEALCFSCRHGVVTTDYRGRVSIYCFNLQSVMQKKITHCSSHDDRTKPSIYDFERLAWTLQTDKNRGPIGFQPPPKRSADEIPYIK